MGRIIYDALRSVNTKVFVACAVPEFGAGVWCRSSVSKPIRTGTGMASGLHGPRRRAAVILTIVFVCLILWFLGLMTSYTVGGVLHILLVVAIVLFLVHIIQGRSIGNA
jgi:uncharacterized membrane protein YtjA (UPF0391 family)